MAASSALAIRPDQTQWDPTQLAALRQLGLERVSPGDLAVFLNYAQRTGLDPFSRQIIMLPRGNKWTIQATVDALRIVAQRTGEYQGQEDVQWCDVNGKWHEVWLYDQPPVAARVGVWRDGFRQPLRAVALWREYVANTPTWRQFPALMIAKCAEALALRKAFPNDLSGIYTAEEMAQAGEAPITVEQVVPEPDLDKLDPAVEMLITSTNRQEMDHAWRFAAAASLLDAEVDGVSFRELWKNQLTIVDGLGESTENPAQVAPDIETAEEFDRAFDEATPVEVEVDLNRDKK